MLESYPVHPQTKRRFCKDKWSALLRFGLEIRSSEVLPWGRIWGIKSPLIQSAVWFPLKNLSHGFPGSQGWLDALWDCWICSSSCGALEKGWRNRLFWHVYTAHWPTLHFPKHPTTSHPIISIYIYTAFSRKVGPICPSRAFSLLLPLPEDTDRTRELKLAAETEASGWLGAQANPVDLGGRSPWALWLRIRKVRWKKMC